MINLAKANPAMELICFSFSYFKSVKELMEKYPHFYHVYRPGVQCELGRGRTLGEDPNSTLVNVSSRHTHALQRAEALAVRNGFFDLRSVGSTYVSFNNSWRLLGWKV